MTDVAGWELLPPAMRLVAQQKQRQQHQSAESVTPVQTQSSSQNTATATAATTAAATDKTVAPASSGVANLIQRRAQAAKEWQEKQRLRQQQEELQAKQRQVKAVVKPKPAMAPASKTTTAPPPAKPTGQIRASSPTKQKTKTTPDNQKTKSSVASSPALLSPTRTVATVSTAGTVTSPTESLKEKAAEFRRRLQLQTTAVTKQGSTSLTKMPDMTLWSEASDVSSSSSSPPVVIRKSDNNTNKLQSKPPTMTIPMEIAVSTANPTSPQELTFDELEHKIANLDRRISKTLLNYPYGLDEFRELQDERWQCVKELERMGQWCNDDGDDESRVKKQTTRRSSNQKQTETTMKNILEKEDVREELIDEARRKWQKAKAMRKV